MGANAEQEELATQKGADVEQNQGADGTAAPQRISFVSASKIPEDEDPVLMSMCKLMASLLRVHATGTDLEDVGSFQLTHQIQCN